MNGRLRTVRAQTADVDAKLNLVVRIAQSSTARPKFEPAYADDARAVARVAGFPLERVLLSIESARLEGIRVVALELSASDGVVHADLEFGDLAVLMRYVDVLNAKESRPRWSLVRVQAASGSAAATFGTASISSAWTGGDR